MRISVVNNRTQKTQHRRPLKTPLFEQIPSLWRGESAGGNYGEARPAGRVRLAAQIPN